MCWRCAAASCGRQISRRYASFVNLAAARTPASPALRRQGERWLAGVSAVLDWDTHVFIIADLTVHLERDAAGDWIALDAETTIGSDGTGQAASTLHDERGRIGRAAQALFVDRRPG